MIDYDLTRRPGRHSEWQMLAAAVIASADPEENYWLESKSRLDWSKPHGVGTLGKAILAFANRDAQRASASIEGRGVVIVTEVEQIDNADLENKLSVYIGGSDGPRWQPHWVSVDEKPVLVVEVDGPQSGDPPYTLRQKFGDYRASQVFVREMGKTVIATQADTERLARRMLAKDVADTLDVALGFTLDEPLSTYFWDDKAVETFIAGEEALLMGSLAAVEAERARAAATKAAREREAAAEAAREVSDSPLGSTAISARYNLGTKLAADGESLASPYELLSRTLQKQGALWSGGLTETHEEERSPEAFAAEVAQYITGVRASMSEVLWTVAKRVVPLPTFWLTNLAPRNYTSVEVTIWVEGDAKAEDEDYEDEVTIRGMLPSRPRKYGQWTSRSAIGSIFENQGYGHLIPSLPRIDYGVPSAGRRDIQNGGSFRARFDPIDLRPGDAQIEVESDLVVLIPRNRVAPVVVRWEATASNIDAIQRGEFELPFEGEPIDVLARGLVE